jgi:hypothetical protein
MNWIEIDKFLYGLIHAAKDEEQLYKDAMKKFSWNRSQAEAAIKPLLKRNTFTEELSKPPKKTSKRSTKRK